MCPALIPDGRISSSWSRNIYSTCSFYCNTGFEPAHVSDLRCNASGEWEWDTFSDSKEKFCIREEEFCPRKIKNGRLANNCGRTDGSVCSYICNSGCEYKYATHSLTCTNKTWGLDTDSLCTSCISCPSRIPNGFIPSSCCSLSPEAECNYYCKSGCSKDLYNLQCSVYGEWYTADIACFCPVSNVNCPQSIPNGYILGSCEYTLGSSCIVGCNNGCRTVYSTVFCNTTGHWDMENVACHCDKSTPYTTTATEDSDKGSISVYGVIGIVLAVFFFAFMVVGGCWFYKKEWRPIQTADLRMDT